MKVLWIAPWFRSLAHIYARGLTDEGHDVQIVTAAKHPEPAPSLVEEVVCPMSSFDPRWLRSAFEVEQLHRKFRPDVVMMDETTDPTFVLLAQRMHAQFLVVHDADAHDHTHELHGIRRSVHAASRRRANHILTFSDHVAKIVATGEWKRPSAQVHQVSLVSDFLDEDVPELRRGPERRDFVFMGRMAPYRNVDHVLRAWAEHVKGPEYRGDRLIIWGAGEWYGADTTRPSTSQDGSVEWRPEVYRYRDIAAGRFSGFKGSLCVYSEASQSGVQLVSAQLGVAPIVSGVGALPEYQAPTLPVLSPTDLQGLVGALDRLADPDQAARLGRIAHEFYMSNNSERVAGKQLANVLEMSSVHS
jgi:glycosyltransferase involved in cell wall biosynthesis